MNSQRENTRPAIFCTCSIPFKFCLLVFQEVKFPLTLDVFELCTPELQQKLIPIRDRFKIMDDKRLEEEKVLYEQGRREGMNIGGGS